jgi:hypothetical protein
MPVCRFFLPLEHTAGGSAVLRHATGCRRVMRLFVYLFPAALFPAVLFSAARSESAFDTASARPDSQAVRYLLIRLSDIVYYVQ